MEVDMAPPGRQGAWKCSSSALNAMLASSGDSTPPTQWAIRAMDTVRVGGWVVVSGGGDVSADRDAMPDDDLLGADEDVFDQQPQDTLAFGCGGFVDAAVQAGEEAFE